MGDDAMSTAIDLMRSGELKEQNSEMNKRVDEIINLMDSRDPVYIHPEVQIHKDAWYLISYAAKKNNIMYTTVGQITKIIDGHPLIIRLINSFGKWETVTVNSHNIYLLEIMRRLPLGHSHYAKWRMRDIEELRNKDKEPIRRINIDAL